MPIATFKGHRVQLHPATDAWMCGDRYGEIVGYISASDCYRVKMDKSGRIYKIAVADVTLVD